MSAQTPALTPAELWEADQMAGMARLIERSRTRLLRETPASLDVCRQLAESLQPDGRWPDIDYSGHRIHGAAGSFEHLKRVRALCLRQAVQGDDFPAAIDAALAVWIETRPQSRNWFHNEINSPRDMRDIVVLRGQELGSLYEGAMSFLRQYRVCGTGANLIWSADVALHDAALCRNREFVAEMVRRISEEIKIGDPEGIQEDFSFFQHGLRLQQLSYGFGFLTTATQAAWVLMDTPWQLPMEKVRVLSRMILEASRWMLRGGCTVPATMDRMGMRQGNLRGRTDLRPSAALLAELDAELAPSLQEISTRWDGPPVIGHRHFPVADITIYHRPAFSLFLKTLSDRTERTESINGENLYGNAMLGNGDAYLITDGREYEDFPPLWDWNLLPGTTYVPQCRERVRRPFVGGVSDGQSGLTVMDYQMGSPRLGMKGRKFWAAHGDHIVCLIGGVSIPGNDDEALLLKRETHPYGLYTALEQCRLRGSVTFGVEKSAPRTLEQPLPGEVSGVRWIHHASFAYLLMQPSRVEFRVGKVRGSWRKISESESSDEIHDQRFMPVIRHGRESLGYILSYAPDASAASAMAAQLPAEILRNDDVAQAVRFADGTIMAAFYRASVIRGQKADLISVDRPCILLVRDDLITVSDPTHQGGNVSLSLHASPPRSVSLPAGGRSVSLDFRSSAS